MIAIFLQSAVPDIGYAQTKCFFEDKTRCSEKFAYKTVNYTNGDAYYGATVENKRHGYGVFEWKDGWRYEGEWLYDKRNGYGVLTSPTGDRYDGEFRNNKFDGHGVHTYASDWRFEGLFRNGSQIVGVHNSPDGGRYSGEIRNGKYDGHGVYLPNVGGRYEGAFRTGVYYGWGIFVFADRAVSEGFRVNNNLPNDWVFVTKDGEVYLYNSTFFITSLSSATSTQRAVIEKVRNEAAAGAARGRAQEQRALDAATLAIVAGEQALDARKMAREAAQLATLNN